MQKPIPIDPTLFAFQKFAAQITASFHLAVGYEKLKLGNGNELFTELLQGAQQELVSKLTDAQITELGLLQSEINNSIADTIESLLANH